MQAWVLFIEDYENNDKDMALYEKETDALSDAIENAKIYIKQYVDSNPDLSDEQKQWLDNFNSHIMIGALKDALCDYDEFVATLYGGEIYIGVYPLQINNKPKYQKTNVGRATTQPIFPNEKPCKCCGKMNDVGITECWHCTNNPG